MLNKFKSLIGKTFRTNRAGNLFTLRNSEFGKINVETDLVRRIVERDTKNLEGIYELNAIVEPPTEKNSLAVRFALALEQNYSAQDISVKLVKIVREILEDYFQIADVEIYMRVTDVVENSAKKNKRRVR